MSLSVHSLASGPGWQVSDIVCTAGPQERPFEEQHDAVTIAIVSEGSFQYRSTHGAAVLGPGSLLLGNPSQCFECGHEHSAGDRCLSFHYEPECFEALAAATPGVRQSDLAASSLPALPELQPLLAEAEVARDEGDADALRELGLELAGTVMSTLAGRSHAARRPSALDERRVTRALRRIEAAAEETLSLADLAGEAATSPYHFLRIFRQIVGLTPHQFILRTRLHRAATRLRLSNEPIGAIAFEVGFNDLSTFNHRFRRVMGVSPSAYRARPPGRLSSRWGSRRS
jgi:AraC family transcriptional regulator